jgi:two-component system sensor kinase FixL
MQPIRGWAGYGVAVIAVAGSLAVRELLEIVGHFYYLPFIPAVMATALLAGRGPTAAAAGLSIAANVALVSRETGLDAAANALLFLAVAWFVAEICWSLRALSQSLAHRNRVLDAILASAPIVTVGHDGRIRFLSEGARTILGAAAGEGPGRPLADFIDNFDLETALRGEGSAVWSGRRPNGETYPLRLQIGVVPNDGEGDHATLSLADLSQAELAEARARELHAQLNRVWRLNSLGEMAASLAHELNQPLSAAATYLHASQAEMERAGLLGQSAGRTLDLAKAQLLRAGAIIRRMRELLAHESRSLGAERVAAMMGDLGGLLSMIQRDSGVTIEVEVDAEHDQVRAERIQFQQAMTNLVRNAVEAVAGRTEGRVRVVGRPVSEGLFEVRVEDNGPGIAPEALETIFRPLMTTKASGMGLGLSVTRTIVESHGGTLAVERSELGGAAFSFRLMREREEDA